MIQFVTGKSSPSGSVPENSYSQYKSPVQGGLWVFRKSQKISTGSDQPGRNKVKRASLNDTPKFSVGVHIVNAILLKLCNPSAMNIIQDMIYIATIQMNNVFTQKFTTQTINNVQCTADLHNILFYPIFITSICTFTYILSSNQKTKRECEETN